jgi:hypothetical protein
VGIAGLHHGPSPTTNLLSGLGDWLVQGIIYLHIMALHAERELQVWYGVGTLLLPFLFFSLVARSYGYCPRRLAAAVHKDQSRSHANTI